MRLGVRNAMVYRRTHQVVKRLAARRSAILAAARDAAAEDKRFYQHNGGATATEYAMLVVFIALALAVGAQALGGGLSNLLTNIASTVTSVTIPSP